MFARNRQSMKKRILLYLTSILLLVACGEEKDAFIVKGTLNNLGGRPLYAVYENVDGISIDTMRPIDGKIEMRGISPQRTAIQLYDASWMPFMRLYMRNGERVELKGDATKKYEIEMKGNSLNRSLWKLTCENQTIFMQKESTGVGIMRGSVQQAEYNKLLAQYDSLLIDYIGRHGGKELIGILIVDYLLRYENFALCDSLWQTLNTEAQPEFATTTMKRMREKMTFDGENTRIPYLRYLDDTDSLLYINPRHSNANLLCIWSAEEVDPQKLHRQLEQYALRYDIEDLQVIALSFDRDTAVWHRAVENDTTHVIDIWGDAIYTSKNLSRYNVTRMPVFMLGDSLGRILVRTSQLPDKDLDTHLDSLVENSKYQLEEHIFKP